APPASPPDAVKPAVEAAPPPWNVPPAPAWTGPAASAAAPASTDADLAAGAQASPEPPNPASDGADVAATMLAPPPISGSEAEREPTTLMPAWQPPPEAPPPVPETMAMPSRQQPGAAVAAGPQGELTIESGPDAGHAHRAGDHVRLGRSPDNDVILRDPATSGHHARLERRDEQQFWLV